MKKTDFRSLQKEWYKKLADSGFEDIEGGVEGHLLKQKTPTLQLGSALVELQGDDKRVLIGGNKKDPKSHERWLDAAIREYYDKGKTEYYDKAQELATMVLQLRHPCLELKYAWSMHSDGYGEEVIADELEVSRSKIRRYLYAMKEKLRGMLDSGAEPC